jgi:hypothetical protein
MELPNDLSTAPDVSTPAGTGTPYKQKGRRSFDHRPSYFSSQISDFNLKS